MGVLIRKQKGVFVFTGIARLAVIGLIVSFGAALIDTVWAVYLDSFIHSVALVGFFSAALTLVSFISYFFFIPVIEKSNKARLYSFSLIIFGIAYILFAINTKFYFFVILAFILTILSTFRATSFGIIIKDKSYEKNLSRNEGLMYTFSNIAWVIGPLVSGFIAEKYSINIIFVLSAIFLFIAFIFFKISKIKDAHIKKKVDANMRKNFLEFFKDKKRILAYILGGGSNLWWNLIYLFIPLFIIRSGLNKAWIGYFLFAVAIPLILFEYKFSKLAAKKGFRKIFKIGYLIPCLLVLLCFFISNIFIILSLLVLASIGLAMLEPTTEAYFFDICKGKEDTRFYGPYNTTVDANSFIGKLLASTLLLFLPFKFIFLLFSLFMFIMFLISCRIKNVIEIKRDGRKNK